MFLLVGKFFPHLRSSVVIISSLISLDLHVFVGQVLLNIVQHLVTEALVAKHFLQVAVPALVISGDSEFVLILSVEHLFRGGHM